MLSHIHILNSLVQRALLSMHTQVMLNYSESNAVHALLRRISQFLSSTEHVFTSSEPPSTSPTGVKYTDPVNTCTVQNKRSNGWEKESILTTTWSYAQSSIKSEPRCRWNRLTKRCWWTHQRRERCWKKYARTSSAAYHTQHYRHNRAIFQRCWCRTLLTAIFACVWPCQRCIICIKPSTFRCVLRWTERSWSDK